MDETGGRFGSPYGISPHEHKDLAGVRTLVGHDFLLAEFACRGNLKRGCILRRPCLRQDTFPLSKAIYHVRQIWHRICLRVRTEDLLRPPFSAGQFGAALKSNMADSGDDYGSRISPHCFRRGATHELHVDGPNDAQIKGAGCWRATGFRAYADTQLTDALMISRLVATASLSAIEDDPDAPANVAFTESIRKRLRPFSARALV